MLPLGPPLEGWAATSRPTFDPESQSVVRVREGHPDLLARQASLLMRLGGGPEGGPWDARTDPRWPRLLSHSEEGRLVTTYHPGLSLAGMIARFGPPAPVQAVRLLLQCAKRLHEVHQADRSAGQPDLRSWIHSAGGVMLPDPGCPDPPLAPAPEVLLGEEEGPAADVYAFGGLTWGLLGGSIFVPSGPERFVALPAMPQAYARLSDPLQTLLPSCLAPDPTARPALPALIEALAGAGRSLPRLALRTPRGRVFPIDDSQTLTIGRNAGGGRMVDLDLSDEPLGLTVSRRHARVSRQGLELLVWSFPGTLDRITVGGTRLRAEPGRVAPGDRLVLGAVELRLEDDRWS